MVLPERFVERMEVELGASEAAALCTSLDTPSPVSVRLNPLKKGDADAECTLLERLGAEERLPWSEEGWYLRERPQFTLDSDFHAGAYYVQEPSSQFVGYLLRAEALQAKRVLDMCAAPGGKTTLYATLVGEEGLVLANEIDRRRAQVLADNVRKWGSGNVAVSCCEAQRLAELEAWFDVVAVDAPCSGEGMFRKDLNARAEWSEGNVRLCVGRQAEILSAAWRCLKPGGVLLYSTCTFNREEDEEQLERLLAQVGDEIMPVAPIAVETSWGIVCGRVGAFQTFRFFPHKARGEGFFVAIARKAEQEGGWLRLPKGRKSPIVALDKGSRAEVARWVQSPEKMHFAQVAEVCYGWYSAQAEAVKLLSEQLPIIYSGVAMGQLFKGRLKPDAALAFFAGLNRGGLSVVECSEEEALRYLRRGEISAEGLSEGLNLITRNGRALGFAKRIGQRVNNLYPKELRILMQ